MSARILVGVLLVMHVWSQSLAAQRTVVEAIDVAPVWAGHPVGLALLTHGDRQFVAFYDAQRRMTVASRPLDSRQWTFQVLPSNLGWDSHNYVTMAIDEGGLVHLAGNMHGHPLIYFRTARPLDVTSFERIEQMVGREEQRMTYPKFLRGPAGELIFTYRDGGSGNGNQIYNVYDPATRAWSRLLDRPLTDGQGRMNAYFHGPVRGPDGFFHLVWVWRDTGDCATNHDLCYARSGDLRTVADQCRPAARAAHHHRQCRSHRPRPARRRDDQRQYRHRLRSPEAPGHQLSQV